MIPRGTVGRRSLALDAVTLIAAGAGALFVCRAARLSPSAGVIAYVLAVIYVARIVSLAVHELGHLAAASLGGWRWDVFKVGPLLLSREAGALRATLDGARRFNAAGLVLTHPPSAEHDTKYRRILMLSGGPVASALLSASAWAASRAVDPAPVRVALGITGVFSAVVLGTAIAPFVSAGNPSDGAAILRLLRDEPDRRPSHAG